MGVYTVHSLPRVRCRISKAGWKAAVAEIFILVLTLYSRFDEDIVEGKTGSTNIVLKSIVKLALLNGSYRAK